MCSNSGQTSSWCMTQHENDSCFAFFNSNWGEPPHSLDGLCGTADDTFFDMIGLPTTSGEMLKPDNCEGNSQSSQMTNQLPPNGGYFSPNANDSSSIPNSDFYSVGRLGTASPYLGTTPCLLTSGEMLKPDNCEGNSQSSQMTNQLPQNGGESIHSFPGEADVVTFMRTFFGFHNAGQWTSQRFFKFHAGYFSVQNAEDSSFIPNSVLYSVRRFGIASPYLDTSHTTPYLLASAEELEPGTSCSKEAIVYSGADMHTLDTHQEFQNSNPSNKNKAPRRKSTFFTINEVEALVQAVLRHGPGRWKMIWDEAFGNNSRRTLQDLRDKWRSLVKTANLPAHKRRGVVPPEWLLERVRYVENGMQIPPAS